MKRSEPISIAEVLRQAIEESDLSDRLAETRAAAAWPSVVGPSIAALTGKPLVDRGVMTVVCRSASLRQELSMQRSLLVRMLNRAARAEAISELRFRGGGDS